MDDNLSLKDKLGETFRNDFPKAVKDNRKILLCVLGIFIVTIITGFFLSQRGGNPVTQIIKEQLEPMQERIQKEIQNIDSFLEMTGFILGNNITVIVQIIGLGVVFGLFPLYALILNGLVIGFFTSLSEYTILQTLSLILPHGVFELTGYILGIGIGIKLGMGSIKSVGDRSVIPLKKAGESVSPLILPAFCLIVFAAFIEGIIGAFRGTIINSPVLQTIIVGGSLISFTFLLLWMSGKLTRSGGR